MATFPEQMHAAQDEQTSHQARSGSHNAGRHGVGSHDIGEGSLAKTLEEQTARLPSDTWLWAAGGSIALSLVLQATDQKQKALFVGQWAPTFLLLGIYNKMVKLHGSE